MSHSPRFTTPTNNDSSYAAGGLTRLFSAIALVATAVAFVGCDGNIPQTNGGDLVIPDVSIAKNASAVSRPLENGESEAADGEEVTQCGEFIAIEESYDEESGDFRYEYVCADDGGDIESVVTAGNDDGAGNGSYTSKYILRNGDEEIWNVSYVLLEDGATQVTTGTSNTGESYTSSRTYRADGSSDAEETYNYNEATYVVSGTYDADGLFSGTTIVDDLSTEQSPDYTFEQTENADGSFSQIYDGIAQGWASSYSYIVAADGSIEYVFVSDDLATDVSPDYEGAYSYAADLSGTGGYTQNYSDGSLLSVEDVINADGSFVESWVFDDAATAQDIDQEGTIAYAADGSGAGSVTTFVDGGDSQTCDITIDVDGTTTTVCQ